ncbi:tripartite tricarboxylate transporter TctB family protein [Franzmannia qiaohouensis]|uniref:Tripartite tricarboxylate transporter TctB family protein n=1 Tax=Franzmannia qiaohouensis TaxID=1329370 RepID=A0ABU1HEN4_9GAMM|nr:tripartite tricarboxylate transporter TctB family protein [Halomonas qiaohouensis]MDR5905757.1 tripartite tricarboxylate transporter TctB family protein [Halomonas qiaohouensis]
MATSIRRQRFPLGSVLFSLSLAAVFGYYAHGVHAAARGVTDWLLILPAAGIGITALLVIVGTKVIDWYRQRDIAVAEDPSALPALLFMGLLALYVVTIPIIGFDLGSLLFLCLALYLQGERRWWVIVGFGVVVSATIVLLFIELLGVRLPTLLL